MPRILHIEDDPGQRRLVRRLLEERGAEVVDAGTGLEGVRLAVSSHPDLVLLDISLPDLEGYEVTLRLRGEEALRDTPIVAFTAAGDREMSLAVGCDGYLGKPIDVDSFADDVLAYLRGKKDSISGSAEIYLREENRRLVVTLERKVEELTEVNRRLRDLERTRAKFYRSISHELSTPLTPVVGYLNLLLSEDLGPLTPLQRQCLRSVQRCTDRVRELIDNLLDATALETGRMHFFTREFDFRVVVSDALESRRSTFEDKSIQVEADLPEEEIEATGDPEKLSRVVVHLLDNAAKFTPEGGRVRLIATASDQDLTFAVCDNGAGVAPDQLDRIFEPFYQVDGSATRTHGGAGLGLAVARKMIEAMGGDIRAASPPASPLSGSGVGTEVAFTIPRRVRRGASKSIT